MNVGDQVQVFRDNGKPFPQNVASYGELVEINDTHGKVVFPLYGGASRYFPMEFKLEQIRLS